VFQTKRQPSRNQKNLLDHYVWGRQTINQLAFKVGRSHVWVRQQLDQAASSRSSLLPQPTVIAVDVTFWGRRYGVCVFRSPTLKRNLWWREVELETPDIYALGLTELQHQGWNIQAVVIDGKRGVAKVFKGLPIQICQFHQMKTVTRYLTRKPQIRAGQELRSITLGLTQRTEVEFRKQLQSWGEDWKNFLNERTPCPCCKPKRWPYTHRKLRAAYRSLTTNLPHLFTYQKYPELSIPNTTNCLDGMFSQIKNRLAVHRGLRRDRRFKIIGEILKGRGPSSN